MSRDDLGDADRVTLLFIGGVGWITEPQTEGFELMVAGARVLTFDVTLEPKEWKSADGEIELFYFPTWKSAVDSAGFFYLTLPRSRIVPHHSITAPAPFAAA